jgi:hypothetical protein
VDVEPVEAVEPPRALPEPEWVWTGGFWLAVLPEEEWVGE